MMYLVYMNKTGKTSIPPTGRMPKYMQRHTQRAHTFADRKKAGRKKAARGRTFKGE